MGFRRNAVTLNARILTTGQEAGGGYGGKRRNSTEFQLSFGMWHFVEQIVH
jgi:hypothetical protein